jgi:hypothetical protein
MVFRNRDDERLFISAALSIIPLASAYLLSYDISFPSSATYESRAVELEVSLVEQSLCGQSHALAIDDIFPMIPYVLYECHVLPPVIATMSVVVVAVNTPLILQVGIVILG